MSLTDLAEAMSQLWTLSTGTEESGKEVSLMSKEGVTCYKCDKKGHKAFECKSKDDKENKEGKKFDGNCSTCGRKRHKAEMCFEDPKNADKVPDWYKKLKAKHEAKEGETSMTSNDTEVSLMVRDSGIPNSVSVLRDPNI